MLAGLLLAASLTLQPPPEKPTAETVHPCEIRMRYNRVRDDSSCIVDLGEIELRDAAKTKVRLKVIAAWEKQSRPKLEDGDIVLLSMSSTSPTWKFLKRHDVNILAGSFRLSPEAEHEGDVIDGGVRESVDVHVSLADLRKIGAAEEVEIALNIWDFRLTAHQVAAIRDMAAMMSVPSEEADRIAFDILEAQKERRWKVEEELKKAVEKARAAVKALPPRKRAIEAGVVGLAKMTEEFHLTSNKYGVTSEEYREMLRAFPEFNSALPYERD